MGLYTSPAGGGALPPDPVFTGVVTAEAFASTNGGAPARSGSFRCGPADIDVVVGRDAGDTFDIQLFSYISGALWFANPSSINYVLFNQYSGGVVYCRFAGADTLAIFGDHVERAKPEIGGDPTFDPSPYGSDGSRDVANPDADYDETPDNYRFRRLGYVGATTAARTINLPPAASSDGYYEKTIHNATGNNITINTVGSIAFGVTIANNKTAIVGITTATALRLTPDV